MHSSYRSRRTPNASPLQFSLSGVTQDFGVNSLAFSNTGNSTAFIEVKKLPNQEEMYPIIKPFEADSHIRRTHRCNRKDCVDRKFEAVKKLNKSSPNVRIVSPRKVDIVLDESSQQLERKKQACIHSVTRFNHKKTSEKDLLKEFKELEQMRKQLKNRHLVNVNKFNFSVNAIKHDKSQKMEESTELNPEKGSLYQEVKTKISKRYNQMFRKYAESAREEMKNDRLFLKDLCSARSLRTKKSSN